MFVDVRDISLSNAFISLSDSVVENSVMDLQCEGLAGDRQSNPLTRKFISLTQHFMLD